MSAQPVDLESAHVECGPLEPGTRVVSDVHPNVENDDFGSVCDVVTFLVPHGEGVALQHAIWRMLRIEVA